MDPVHDTISQHAGGPGTHPDRQAGPQPPPGEYPDGRAGHRGTWDGHAWTGGLLDEGQPAVASHRSPVRAVGGWWLLLALVGVAVGIMAGLHAEQDPTVLWRAVATVGAVTTMLWFVAVLHQRLRLGEVIGVPALVGLGLLSGGVAFAAALGIGRVLSAAGVRENSVLGNLSAGPTEEIAKLLVPTLLWLVVARFRDPRTGFAIVVVGAAVFGVLEAWEYTVVNFTEPATHTVQHADREVIITRGSPVDQVLQMAVTRPWVELLHPLFAGFAAAVIWRAAWLGRHLITAVGCGALLVVVAIHGGFDALSSVLDSQGAAIASFEGVLAITLLLGGWFGLLRPVARMLVPPTAVAANAVGWRPRVKPPRLPAPPSTQA